MKPKKRDQSQLNLFTSRLDQILNPEHPLFILAGKIDWSLFEEAVAGCYSEDMGAPAKATRLMVGLHYLKHAFNESDESVVAKWVENVYWQWFCGFEFMQHDLPIHPTSMTKWRNRVGKERMELLLKATLDVALIERFLQKRELAHVTVDTTVQEKNIAHPTDSGLLLKAIFKLGKAAADRKIPLRQSYRRVAKKAAHKASRYAHAKQYKRMHGRIRFLRTRLGRLIRDIESNASTVDDGLLSLLALCKRLFEQKRTDKKKLYSLHEPEVQCISKGKARTRYEFGCKVSLATTNRGDWFVAVNSLIGNPYDGHTLASAMAAVEGMTGVPVKHVYVDKGYRGHDYAGDGEVHIPGMSSRNVTWSIRRRCRRRSAIEPKIGHAKAENRMGRCFLKGLVGDAINAVLAVAGANFRKLMNCFLLFLSLFFRGQIAGWIREMADWPNPEAHISLSQIGHSAVMA